MKNNYDYAVDFSDVNEREVYLNAHVLKGLNPISTDVIEILKIRLEPGEELTKTVKVKMPDVEGKFDLRFSIQVEGIEAPINGRKQRVIVK